MIGSNKPTFNGVCDITLFILLSYRFVGESRTMKNKHFPDIDFALPSVGACERISGALSHSIRDVVA